MADFSTVLPLVATALTMFGGAAVYRWQKRIDRDAEHLRLRQQIYSDFLRAHQQVLTNTIRTEDNDRRLALDAFLAAELQLSVFAPFHVATKIEPFHLKFEAYTKRIRGYYEKGYSANHNLPIGVEALKAAEQEYSSALNELVEQMRLDAHLGSGETKVLNASLVLASREITQ